jgi:anti-sigma B factor antagonist
MRITQRTTQDVTVLDLDGRLITDQGAELLRDKIMSVFSQGQSKVILNLAAVPHIDSGGLGELVRCYLVAQRASGSVKLVGLNGRVVNLLTITRLITVFETYDTEQDALASFAATV